MGPTQSVTSGGDGVNGNDNDDGGAVSASGSSGLDGDSS